jgi:hypothetical protein
MKRLLILLSFPFLWSNCEKIDDWTRYTVAFENQLVVIAPIKTVFSLPEEDSINVVTSPLFLPPYDEKLESHGDDRDKVEKVRMSEFHFSMSDLDSNENFDFLNNIEFFMHSPGVETLKIGQVTSMGNGFRSVSVGITFPWEQDVTSFLENGYKIEIKFSADAQIPDNLTFVCKAHFQIDTKKFFI